MGKKDPISAKMGPFPGPDLAKKGLDPAPQIEKGLVRSSFVFNDFNCTFYRFYPMLILWIYVCLSYFIETLEHS